ncbi:putative transcription factor c2h2 [Diplodia seriata]|uniref:Putative transcription factor c2h2 n=1 Tax=Diplodia seriata TaxID=420778 RepID=A0A0G2E0X6_9PEZI|nr:putative transcription factor c2h2 [Diplodia seriata]
METNYMATAAARSASPSTFTLSKGRNNRLSLLSSGSSIGTGRSVDARSLTRSPPPSYDGLTGPPVASSALAGDDRAAVHDGSRGDGDVSATLDAHLPLSVSDKGWSEVESVSKQFLAENLPGWIASMQAESGGGGDHGRKTTATTFTTTSPTTTAGDGQQQQKQLSQMIKAGVRKGRKGLVLRLLRRTADANEIVDLRLDNTGAFHGGGGAENIKRSVPPGPDAPAHAASKQRQGGPPALPVELEARPPATVVRQVPGIHEAPAGPDVFELPTTTTTTPATTARSGVPLPTVVVPPPPSPPRAADQATAAAPTTTTTDQAEQRDDADEDGHVSLATSPTESLLRTLSFGPEEASAWSEPVALDDADDTGSDSDHSPPPSSIVPTPTKGLSVRHATHKVIKRSSHISTHMHELRDASQGTFDGSVTLPTLIVPDDDQPDSPGGSLWLPSNIEIRPLPEKRSAAHRFLSHAARATLAQLGRVAAGLYDAYGPEKPVPKDHVRVRWTCTCGKELYDDFVERRRGAARELEAYLNRPRAHAPSPSPNSNSSANSSFSDSSQIFSSTNPSLNPSPATTWGSSFPGDSSSSSSNGSNYSPTALRSNNPFSVRIGTLPPPRWLLTCADEGQSVAKLSHVDVTETKIRSDRDLAMAVRGLYAHINRFRWWWAPLRLRGLASIDFVQFEVHRNRVVDIRKCPDMPPPSADPS